MVTSGAALLSSPRSLARFSAVKPSLSYRATLWSPVETFLTSLVQETCSLSPSSDCTTGTSWPSISAYSAGCSPLAQVRVYEEAVTLGSVQVDTTDPARKSRKARYNIVLIVVFSIVGLMFLLFLIKMFATHLKPKRRAAE